jgi:hypothetical protein
MLFATSRPIVCREHLLHPRWHGIVTEEHFDAESFVVNDENGQSRCGLSSTMNVFSRRG